MVERGGFAVVELMVDCEFDFFVVGLAKSLILVRFVLLRPVVVVVDVVDLIMS